MLIADTLCGLMSESGRARPNGVLDELFGVVRDGRRGYLNGRTLTEVDAENFDRPFPQRLHAYDGALRIRRWSSSSVARAPRQQPPASRRPPPKR